MGVVPNKEFKRRKVGACRRQFGGGVGLSAYRLQKIRCYVPFHRLGS